MAPSAKQRCQHVRVWMFVNKAGDVCSPPQMLPFVWKLHCDELPRAQQRSQLNGSPCSLSELSSLLPPFGLDVFRLAALWQHMWYDGDRLGGTVADVATPVARAKILGTSGRWGGAAINVATCDACVVTDTAICVAWRGGRSELPAESHGQRCHHDSRSLWDAPRCKAWRSKPCRHMKPAAGAGWR